VESLLRHRARKNKLNFLKEKPADCLGKSKHPKQIREALGVPIKTAETATTDDTTHHLRETDHYGDEDDPRGLDDTFRMPGESKADDRDPGAASGPRYGGIPSGRSAGRPPAPSAGHGGVNAARYERSGSFSDDGSRAGGSYSDRFYGEEKQSR
jgi:hypothetical protein